MSSIRCSIGRHQIWVEQDVVRAHIIGPILPDAATQLLQLADQQFREHGRVFLFVDVGDSDLPGPETRRVIASWPYLGRYVAVMFGLGTLSRAATQLILSAQRVLGGPVRPTVHFCSSESEAHAMLVKLRS